ncbi:hypothetical protein GOD82_19015 [Sinorhizobium medicae]|nr:hypothetical protein [Sinorhizobium medicae]
MVVTIAQFNFGYHKAAIWPGVNVDLPEMVSVANFVPRFLDHPQREFEHFDGIHVWYFVFVFLSSDAIFNFAVDVARFASIVLTRSVRFFVVIM